MELISIRRFEFMSWSRRCGPARCHRAQGSGTPEHTAQDCSGRVGQDKGPALLRSQKCFLIWRQCSFYLWSPDHHLSLFQVKQAKEATAPEAEDGEAGPVFAAGGPSHCRQRLPPRPLAVCLGTRGFSRYSITHPTGVLPGYRPL